MLLVQDIEKKSPIGVGSDVEGMAIKPDGYKIYTASMTGPNQIKEFYLSTPWDIDTIAAGPTLDVVVVNSLIVLVLTLQIMECIVCNWWS